MTRVAILISGAGSNMLHLCQSMIKEKYAKPVLVLSDQKRAKGLRLAEDLGINVKHIDPSQYNKDSFDKKIVKELKDVQADLICLAGFMRVLGPYFITQFPNNIINIHPSLLPKYKGLNTHSRALESQDKEAGCTVHRVTKKIDDGLILGQASVPISTSENPASLAEKVLRLEHVLYPIVLKRLINKKVIDDDYNNQN
ncbi:MAG: phosphoribosylglycinamide formyltransferase [Paracoccaceae bacterium]